MTRRRAAMPRTISGSKSGERRFRARLLVRHAVRRGAAPVEIHHVPEQAGVDGEERERGHAAGTSQPRSAG